MYSQIKIQFNLQKWIVPQQINSINITVPMSVIQNSDYHFCTLNESQHTKPMPSLDFVRKLVEICRTPQTLFESGQRNIYDRKNHILYINNFQAYASTLKQKYGRSVVSFEKQLKMMGFKKRKNKQYYTSSLDNLPPQTFNKMSSFADLKQDLKTNQHKRQSNEEHSQINRNFNSLIFEQKEQKNNEATKYMFMWRTNRSALIEKQLEAFQLALAQEVERAVRLREQVEKRKKQLDARLETIIFQTLIKFQDSYFTELDTQISPQTPQKPTPKCTGTSMLQTQLNEALEQLKSLSNSSQLQSKQIVKRISKNSANELQLYRIAIYKESHLHKTVEDQQ